MNLPFVFFDVALAVVAVRSIWVLRERAVWTRSGWAATFGYCLAAAVEFSVPAAHVTAGYVAWGFLALLTTAFAIGFVRDEPQAEPWHWPVRESLTRAERRASSGR